MFRFCNALILVLLVFSNVSAQEKAKQSSGGKTADSTKPAEITWLRYDDGIKLAQEKGKHVLVDFVTKWCGYCKRMDRTTFVEPELVRMLNDNFVAIRVDAESAQLLNVKGYKITERDLAAGEYQVRSYPAFWFLKPDGSKLGLLQGYRESGQFLEVLFFMKEKLYDKMTFDDYIKKGGRKAFSRG